MRVQVPSKAGPAPMSSPSHATRAGGQPPTLARSQYSSHSFSAVDVEAPVLQAKLIVGAADDSLEQEADRVAEQVMRMRDPELSIAAAPPRLARTCGACEEEETARTLQTKPAGSAEPGAGEAPPIVHEALRRPGQLLDSPTRATFERRFGHDFSRVRIHTDSVGARSAQAVNSLAYTVGRDIVFAPGRYQPASVEGQLLIAHELTHVIQQRSPIDPPSDGRLVVDAPRSAHEAQARLISAAAVHGPVNMSRPGAHAMAGAATLSRADPDAVGQIMKLRTVVGAGIQFWPTNVTDTQIGPVTVLPGLLSSGASRLNVIIGENLTPRILARELLPLWTTATPFTPPGGGAPIPVGAFSEEQLAKGLLVYNQYYLPVPAMTQWRTGLRFPLPVEIDEATGIAAVNADAIRSLASTFDPAWMPALDQRAAATVAPPAATVRADVTAFLARETSVLARGIGLAARAITNAQSELPFIREAFAQLGAGGFNVALAFMDDLVNRDIGLLAAQRDGAAIIAVVRAALVPPAGITPTQQASLDRANAMFGRVAGVTAAAPSAAAPTRAEKVVTVDTVKLDGSNFNPATQVAIANAIYAQCNVRFTHGVNSTATAAQTAAWLGADKKLGVAPSCGAVSAEERALYQGASAAFGFGARIRAHFASDFTGYNASGYSLPPYCATGPAAPFVNIVVVANSGDTSTLAHEIGHILLNSGAHPANTIMSPRPRPDEITDPQCTTIYSNA